MPPRSPLPQRHGLDAAWMRTPDRDPAQVPLWATMSDWLVNRMPEFVDVVQMLNDERIVYGSGVPVQFDDAYQPHTFVWFHRDLPEETTVPGEVHIVHQDERLVVVDKPPFLSSIPRGSHIQQSVVVRMRKALGMSELTPLHRLDRVTSGLLMMATEKRWRGPYQSLFAERAVTKIYRALARHRPELELPVTVRNHIDKPRGQLHAQIVPDAPINAESLVERESVSGEEAVYKLTPSTGRTHQLRIHMRELGIPIVGDPLYPVERKVAIDDFSEPLQLLAAELSFIDPFDGRLREFRSVRSLPC